ncbi:MAG: hypothetical protein QM696_00755 [Steroidobacteraceae bacterium]
MMLDFLGETQAAKAIETTVIKVVREKINKSLQPARWVIPPRRSADLVASSLSSRARIRHETRALKFLGPPTTTVVGRAFRFRPQCLEGRGTGWYLKAVTEAQRKLLQSVVKDGVKIQHRFSAAPVYARTGRGQLKSEGTETLHKIKRNLKHQVLFGFYRVSRSTLAIRN